MVFHKQDALRKKIAQMSFASINVIVSFMEETVQIVLTGHFQYATYDQPR